MLQRSTVTAAIEFTYGQVNHAFAHVETECKQSGAQLGAIDGSTTIAIELLKTVFPLFNISPQGGEFVETDGPAMILIKQIHQQMHSFRIKRLPVAVDKCTLQIVSGQSACMVLIDRGKPVFQLLVVRYVYINRSACRSPFACRGTTCLDRADLAVAATWGK